MNIIDLVGGLVALAQMTAPQPGQTSNAPRITAPPVLVTAQKEPADPRALPVSITTVSGDLIASMGAKSVSEAAAFAPNVFFSEFTARKLSNARFRGVGASPANPAVTTFIDGVPQLNSNTASGDLLDIGQIEFVRGAASALFGRNTLGGLINISSARPSLTAWTGTVSAPFGSHGSREFRGSVSGPLGDRVGLSVSMGYGEREGFTTNTMTGNDLDFRKATSGKGQMLFVPSDNWEARVIVSGERARDGDYALGDLASIRKTPFNVSRDFEGKTDRDILSTTVNVRREGASMVFNATGGWLRWKTEDVTDLDYTPLSLIRRDNTEEATQMTGEIRLASAAAAPVQLGGTTKLRWQIGASVFTQNYDQAAINTFSPFVLSQFINFPVSQHSPDASLDDTGAAIYGQGTFVMNDRVDVSVGARYDHERKTGHLNSFFAPAIAPASLVDKEKTFTNVSPQLGISFKVGDDDRLYGSFGKGFKAGGFNPVSLPGSELYNAERTWTGEAGVKMLWSGGKIGLNAAAFAIDWDELQLNLLIPNSGGQFYISNVGSATSSGLEAELTANPNDVVSLFASAGMTRARFGFGTTTNGVNVTDKHLPNTPDYNAALGVQLSKQAGTNLRWFARADWIFTGAFKYDEANMAAQDAYSIANLNAGIHMKYLSITGWLRNAFDTRYVPLAFAYGPFAPSGFVGEMGRPRTFGVTLSAKF